MADLSAAVWLKSAYCSGGNCIEMAVLDNQVAMRDSRNTDGPVLLFSVAEWHAFADGVRHGQFVSVDGEE
jgi:uncharacterized protein DUF397